MTPFMQECAAQFRQHTPVLTVLVIGAAVLLTRRSRSARSGAALLLGLLAFLAPWILVSSALVAYFYPPLASPTPRDDGVVADLAMHGWGLAYTAAETVAVVVMARVVRDAARDRRPAVAATGEPRGRLEPRTPPVGDALGSPVP